MDDLEEMDRYQPPKTEPGRNGNHEQPNYKQIEIETVIKNLPKTKAQGLMASQGNSIKHSEKS